MSNPHHQPLLRKAEEARESTLKDDVAIEREVVVTAPLLTTSSVDDDTKSNPTELASKPSPDAADGAKPDINDAETMATEETLSEGTAIVARATVESTAKEEEKRSMEKLLP